MTGLDVRGGRGGVRAGAEDQCRWASLLDEAGDAVRRAAVHATDTSDLALLARTSVWAPRTAVLAGARITDGVLRVAQLAARAELQAEALRATAAAVEAADVWPDRLVGTLQEELGTVGVALTLAEAAARFLSPRSLVDVGRHAATTDASLQDAALDRLQELGTDLLVERPWLVDLAVNGGADLLEDVLDRDPLLVDLLLDPLLPGDLGTEGAARLLHAWLDGTGRLGDRPVVLGERFEDAGLDPPSSPGELALHLDALMASTRHDPTASRIAITRVTRADGGDAWIVQVPGTQAWDLGGADPSDMTTNLGLMADADPALLDAVVEAVRRAGVPPTDPVLTAGHSQGGMTATRLAARLVAEGHTVTHTLTLGSPTAHMPVPAGTQALSIEHTQDPVPRLDGAGNPDAPNRTTVTAPAPVADLDDPFRAHGLDLYTITLEATMASGHPSVDAWYAGAEHVFFTGDGDGDVRWLELTRPERP